MRCIAQSAPLAMHAFINICVAMCQVHGIRNRLDSRDCTRYNQSYSQMLNGCNRLSTFTCISFSMSDTSFDIDIYGLAWARILIDEPERKFPSFLEI